MKGKRRISLAIGALLLAIVAWWSSNPITTPSAADRLLFPDLDVNSIDTIQVSDAAETATVVKVDHQWVVPQFDHYPADFERIRRLLIKLQTLKAGQQMTVSQQQRERMELSPDKAVSVMLWKGDDLIADMSLGAFRQPAGNTGFMTGNMGRFIQVSNEPKIHIIDDGLTDATAQAHRWLDTLLVDVNPAAITSITMENPEEGSWTLKAIEDHLLEPVAPAFEFDSAQSRILRGAFRYLTFDNVIASNTFDHMGGFDDGHRFIAQSDTGLRYEALLTTDEDGMAYARLAVTALDLSHEGLADADENASTVDQARKLNQRFARWVYQLPQHKADIMMATKASLTVPDDHGDSGLSNDPITAEPQAE